MSRSSATRARGARVKHWARSAPLLGPGRAASAARRAWNCAGRVLGQSGLGPLRGRRGDGSAPPAPHGGGAAGVLEVRAQPADQAAAFLGRPLGVQRDQAVQDRLLGPALAQTLAPDGACAPSGTVRMPRRTAGPADRCQSPTIRDGANAPSRLISPSRRVGVSSDARRVAWRASGRLERPRLHPHAGAWEREAGQWACAVFYGLCAVTGRAARPNASETIVLCDLTYL